VDDEYDVVYSLKTVLEETKLFLVDGYVDPMHALSNFKPDTYDLVVLECLKWMVSNCISTSKQ
jgi:hypothetical protein